MSDNREDSTGTYAPRAKELCSIQEGGNLAAHLCRRVPDLARETLVPIHTKFYAARHVVCRFFFISFLFLFLPSRGEHANFSAKTTRGTGRSRKQCMLNLFGPACFSCRPFGRMEKKAVSFIALFIMCFRPNRSNRLASDESR